MKSVQEKQHIVILGGGFAGVNALLSLEKRFAHEDAVEITMISNENFLLFTPMLSEVAIGAVEPRHIVSPIRELCKKAYFHRGDVQAIDLQSQTVDIMYKDEAQPEQSQPNQSQPDQTQKNKTSQHQTLHYDQLILAMGSVTNMKTTAGAEEYAFNFKEIIDALKIRSHLLDMFEQADTCYDPVRRQSLLTFSVIGAGYSGVEVAAAIQELIQRILPLYPTISSHEVQVLLMEADDRIIRTMPEDLAQFAHQELVKKGIQIFLKTPVKAVEWDGLTLESGKKIASDTVIWTTGIAIPELVMKLPLTQQDEKGRPISTTSLQLSGYTNVWAIGDNVRIALPHPQKGFYTATAQSAIEEGKHVAKNIAHLLQGEPLEPFNYQSKGEMVVLGDKSAIAQIFGYKIKGFPAWVIWRLYYLSALPDWKKKVRVAADWIMNMFGPLETAQIQFHRASPKLPIVKEKPLVGA